MHDVLRPHSLSPKTVATRTACSPLCNSAFIPLGPCVSFFLVTKFSQNSCPKPAERADRKQDMQLVRHVASSASSFLCATCSRTSRESITMHKVHGSLRSLPDSKPRRRSSHQRIRSPPAIHRALVHARLPCCVERLAGGQARSCGALQKASGVFLARNTYKGGAYMQLVAQGPTKITRILRHNTSGARPGSVGDEGEPHGFWTFVVDLLRSGAEQALEHHGWEHSGRQGLRGFARSAPSSGGLTPFVWRVLRFPCAPGFAEQQAICSLFGPCSNPRFLHSGAAKRASGGSSSAWSHGGIVEPTALSWGVCLPVFLTNLGETERLKPSGSPIQDCECWMFAVIGRGSFRDSPVRVECPLLGRA